MSDFLERLVERSRGETPPAIRPRLPSVFETGLALARESASPPSGEQEEASPALHRGPLIPVQVTPPLLPQAEREPDPSRSEPHARSGWEAPETTARPSPERRSETRAEAPPREATPAATIPERPAAALPRPGPIEPRAIRPEPPQRDSASPGRERADEDGGGEAAPVVRVTIGRIDVRAITEAPPPLPPVRNAPEPRLSLDEYLRQRMRGER